MLVTGMATLTSGASCSTWRPSDAECMLLLAILIAGDAEEVEVVSHRAEIVLASGPTP